MHCYKLEYITMAILWIKNLKTIGGPGFLAPSPVLSEETSETIKDRPARGRSKRNLLAFTDCKINRFRARRVTLLLSSC